ncbi:MAG: RNA 2',3'-cyclic phosphodiesterase [Bacteroidota bacterium]
MNESLHRSFVAIFPPKDILGKVQSVQTAVASLAPHAQWVRPELFHCTLEFLGNKPMTWLEQLAGQLTKEIVSRPFQIVLDRAGCFPSQRSPKVFWLGSEKGQNTDLIHLASVIRSTCLGIGHQPADDHFRPHITIGRAKGKIDIALIQNLETVTFQPITFVCNEIRVMKSTLASTGSTYTILFTIPLK